MNVLFKLQVIEKRKTEKHNALHLLISSMSWKNAQEAPLTGNEMTITCSLVNTKIFIASPREKPHSKVFP